MTYKRAVLFPGQGAHDLNMLDGVKDLPGFRERYDTIAELTQSNPLKEIAAGNEAYINANLMSSALTVLVSTLSYDRFLGSNEPPAYFSGYSVGQWTALWAAGVIEFEQLVSIIIQRCTFMDACFEEQKGAMLAVIGLPEDKIQGVCEEITSGGDFVTISNYNCVGQYSIAGTDPGINKAETALQLSEPKKLARIPVGGAWHCALLDKAADQFASYLETIDLQPLQTPVINNVTGALFNTDINTEKEQLALHISRPVLWYPGIRQLVDLGAEVFTEMGYGKTLTKFGFFIDRKVKHEGYYNG